MYRIGFRLLVAIGLLVGISSTVHAQFCTESMLRGSYAYRIQGHAVVDPEAPPVPFMSIAIATFDYHGNDHTEGTLQTPEGMVSSTGDGVVEMERDCRYVETYTLQVPGLPPMEDQKEQCLVIRGGEEINCASMNVGANYRSYAKRMQSPGLCNTGMLRGDFALHCNGWIPSGPEGAPLIPGNGAGILSYDYHGDYSGSVSSNYTFAHVSRSFEGQVTVNSDCTTTWSQADEAGNVDSGIGIVVSGNEMFVLVNAPGGAVSCVAKRIRAGAF